MKPRAINPAASLLAIAAFCLIVVTVYRVPAAEPAPVQVKNVDRPPVSSSNPHYIGNRDPLLPNPLMKLPIGSIKPKGWLRHQLELEADGMIGYLEEISKWCKFEDSAWATPDGQGQFGWEELPYWLKGYGDLGYVLGNERIIEGARKWIDATLASQAPDGYFGPRANKTGLNGHPDLWPHMVMLNVLQSFHEFTGDPRVLPFMTRYMKWLNSLPPESFGRGYWPQIRFGDNIESAYWLYNRTGDSFLLDLAKKIHENMARWDSGVINWHNVNIAQGFRAPAVFYVQAKEQRLLDAAERNYRTVMDLYGQFPGGGFAGDENCRAGYYGPRQGFETCGIVEFMHSFQMLTKISGNPLWADRCEEITFNSFPASLTPDQKALHYLTCANQVQLDTKNKAPAIQNGGNMFAYSPYEVYRCCQHNVSHGWPYYAEELWLATPDSGLCASLYAASEVTAQVGDGTKVTIMETTDYPFEERVAFRVEAARAVRFPLYLRIPQWCSEASATLNGDALDLKARPLSYAVISREWKPGDELVLNLPMKVSVRRWEKNHDSVSVDHGPLTYSLKIGEQWVRYGGSDKWPEHEVYPTTPWNYGLLLNKEQPEKSFKVMRKSGPLPDQPFTPETAPIEIQAKAKRISGWTQDRFGLVGKLQPSPAKSIEPEESITLIPMGSARLRISSFPTVSDSPDAHEWTSEPRPPVSSSHCHGSDSEEAMIDGREPSNSNDNSIPRFTWWDRKGSTEWVQYDFDKERNVSAVEVYWFDDARAGGGCRVPKSWRLLYRKGDDWLPVQTESGHGIKLDGYNRVSFGPVKTSGLRIEAQLQPGFSGGILEWKVENSATTVSKPLPYGPTPTGRQLKWHEMEFYGFIHFTVNTFTDKEWGYGDEGEELFNPMAFDANQIASVAKAAGMKGLILTAKHHDGFCLWPSKYTEHSVKNSPWKNGQGDVVKELSDACRRNGIKLGVYLSPWDRNHKDYARPEYITYYRNQIRELLTGYGDIFTVWFDGANGGDGYYGGARETRRIDNRTYYDWPNTWKLVRELMPDAVMFSDAGPDFRWVGNEQGIAGDPCWATLNLADRHPGGRSDGLNSGERPGTHWIPAECDVSIRPGWFYHAKEDDMVKSPEKLLEIYYKSVGRGACLNLNLPPDRRGLIHENDIKSLQGFRRILDQTFAKDLAQGAKLRASNFRGGAGEFSPSNLTDGKRDTYWATDDAVTTPELVVELNGPTTFNVISLREYLPLGQRVEAFALDQWQEGEWQEFAKGTSIGNLRLLRTEPVTTQKVRLRITKAPVCPALSEFGLHVEPKQ